MISRKPIRKIVLAMIERQKLSRTNFVKEVTISDMAVYWHIAELQETDIIELLQGTKINTVYSIKCEMIE